MKPRFRLRYYKDTRGGYYILVRKIWRFMDPRIKRNFVYGLLGGFIYGLLTYKLKDRRYPK